MQKSQQRALQIKTQLLMRPAGALPLDLHSVWTESQVACPGSSKNISDRSNHAPRSSIFRSTGCPS